MQSVNATISGQIAAQKSTPVYFIEIYLDAGTLRYVLANQNIVFPTGGSTYYAIAGNIGTKQMGAEGQITEVDISLDNLDGGLAAYNEVESFAGKKIVIKEVYYGYLASSANYRELFSGYMQEPTDITDEWISFKASEGATLQDRILLEVYQRNCNNNFGDAKCNYNGYANLASLRATGTVDSGTVSTLVDAALTQADNYWNYGDITIVSGSNAYSRKVSGFVSSTHTVTIDVPLPMSIAAGMTYTILKGCPGTIEACSHLYAYGPSADNILNFNGDPDIPD
jgi:hypothetical protein